jgi:hypothetical protein
LFTATCILKFPGTTAGALGAAINGKLTELRLKQKKAANGVGGGYDKDGNLD